MITQSELKELLHYDPDTGVFTWKVKRNGGGGINPGDIAGYLHDKGHSRKYWRIQLKGKYYYRSRLAWLYTFGYWPTEIDHLDSNSLDDRLSNLCDKTRYENMRNQRLHKTNKTGVSGIYFEERIRKFRVAIGDGCGGQKKLGDFYDFFDAVCCRKSAENKLGYSLNHGKKADTNGRYIQAN